MDNTGTIHTVYSSIANNNDGYRYGDIQYARIASDDFRDIETFTGEYSEHAVLEPAEVIIDYAIFEGNIIAVDRDNEVLISNDDGEYWDRFPVMEEEYIRITDIDYLDSNHLMISTNIGFFISEDGGESWSIAYSTPETASGIEYLGENHFIGYSRNRLYTSLNGNDSAFVFQSQYFKASSFINESNGWVVGSRGSLYKTTNGGRSWQQVESESIPRKASAICFIGHRIGWLTTTQGQIWKTDNAGIDWELLFESEESNIRFECITARGWNIYAAGAGYVLYSDNGIDFETGFEWDIERQFVTAIAEEDGVYICDWKGRIYRRDPDGVTKPTINPLILNTFTLGAIYPNPFNRIVNINFSLNQSRKITAKVFDIMGHQVAVLMDTQVLVGSHQIAWSPSITSGKYYLTISLDEGEVCTHPMLLLK